MLESIYSQIFGVVTLLVLIFAFWKGEELEKIGIMTHVLAWFATMVMRAYLDPFGVRYPVFAVDVVVLLVFVGLAWKSPRTWPIWAAGCQMFAILGHVVTLLGVRPNSYSFDTLLAMSAYGVLASIAVGTFIAWQERLASGAER